MKSIKLSAVFLFLLVSTVGNAAWAGRSHGHVGIYFGAPLVWPGYYSAPYYGPSYYPSYGYPYYSAPTIVTVPVSPPVYIEQEVVPAAPAKSSDSWYYCNNPDGYYPYVKACPTGWQKVAPTP